MKTQEKTTKNELPLAKTRRQKEFWEKQQPVIRVAATDTYKRTMSASNEIFAENFTCYSVSARRALNEKGANGRLVMAGLEATLYPWFMNPIDPEEIKEASEFFKTKAQVKKFNDKVWNQINENGGFFPVDVYGLPGGQTFLAKDGKYVPHLSFEGPGTFVTHFEPHLEERHAEIIYATKARLFREAAGKQFAEFGLRSNKAINLHPNLMLALKVGGDFEFTSDDQSAMLFPEYFKDIGTIGHEYIMSFQKKGRTLEEAQDLAYETFVAANERSALLPDVIDTIRSGLPAIMRLIKKYEGSGKVIMPRFDSGNIVEQCLIWKRMTLDNGYKTTKMVVEDGFTPEKAREVKRAYAEAGYDPEEIIVGAGGYFQEGNLRDAISLVDKRGATMIDGVLESSLKFSDSPGKESIPGRLRIYERGRTIIVAQAGEKIDGKLISVPLVLNGRIVYNEDINVQARRAEETWNRYDKIEYSPWTQLIINERLAEKNAITERYALEAVK